MPERLRVCRHCRGEMHRSCRNGAYHYSCHCLVWKEHLAVLDHARRKEEARAAKRRAG